MDERIRSWFDDLTYETLMHSGEGTRHRIVAPTRYGAFAVEPRRTKVSPDDCWIRLFSVSDEARLAHGAGLITMVRNRRRMGSLTVASRMSSVHAFYRHHVAACIRVTAYGWTQAPEDAQRLYALALLGADVADEASRKVQWALMWSPNAQRLEYHA